MGVCASTNAEDKLNAKIAKEQAEASRVDSRYVKLLFLGAGDSGKTTLRKQMRNLYGTGFSEMEKKMTIPVIYANIIEGCAAVLNAMVELNETLNSDVARKAGKLITDIPPSAHSKIQMTPELAASVKLCWDDAGFQRVRNQRSKFQLQDCWDELAKSLASSYPTWGGPYWTPTADECISVRVRTSGVLEEELEIEKLKFKIFDVGGQRAERRKWVTCFDNVTAVIWVSAISDYDQVLFEDNSKNRLEESVELFGDTINNQAFVGIPVMIFLNKKDLFEKKYVDEGIGLNASGKFSDAPAGSDIDTALAWFKSLFLKRIEDKERVYLYTTCATDPASVRTVFDTVRHIILKRTLESTGFPST